MWADVTSPLARRVLKRLYDSSPAITDQRDLAMYERKSSGLELEYRTWVRERLERDGVGPDDVKRAVRWARKKK